MRRYLMLFLLCYAAFIGWFNMDAAVQADTVQTKKIFRVEIKDAIGPATADYFERALKTAQNNAAEMVVLELDTPGGLDLAMRDIVQAIIASTVPVVTYVSPAGARAASAGTYILYASHVAAMAPGTNLGAATPVQIGGGNSGFSLNTATPQTQQDDPDLTAEMQSEGTPAESEEEQALPDDAMSRKIVNDAEAYLRSLAQLRDRNEEWAAKAVREGASLSAEDALDKGVIEYVAVSLSTLLDKLDQQTVTILGEEQVLVTQGVPIENIEPDWRNKLLSVITNPNVAYILMMLGMYGLFFELANPGSVFPGVIGGICILLALFAFQALPINYAGMGLIALGIAFILAEAFLPSFGILGIGGIIAFVIGSIIMMDSDVPGYTISPALILGISLSGSILLLWMIKVLLKIRRKPVVIGTNSLVGQVAECISSNNGQLKVTVLGEIWNAQTQSTADIVPGQVVKITDVQGLMLTVEAVAQY